MSRDKVEANLLHLWDKLMGPGGLSPDERAELLDTLYRADGCEELVLSDRLTDRIEEFRPPDGSLGSTSSSFPRDPRSQLSRASKEALSLVHSILTANAEVRISVSAKQGTDVYLRLESKGATAADQPEPRGDGWALRVGQKGEYTLVCHLVRLTDPKHSFHKQVFRVIGGS